MRNLLQQARRYVQQGLPIPSDISTLLIAAGVDVGALERRLSASASAN